MIPRRRLACAVGLLCAGVARAHVAPSRDLNNRYLRATLLPDGLRVTYTLLFGDLPGATERRRMDADGDGRLAPAEASAFGARVLDEIAPRLSISVDGHPGAGWRVTDVGLGSPIAAGGSFAVDLELHVPYGDPSAAEHTVGIDDLAALPAPGDVELRIDESPGVRVLESHLATERTGIELGFAFTGNAPAPGQRAVFARFTIDPLVRAQPPRTGRRAVPLVALAAAIALGAAAIFAARRRRSR